MHLCQKNDGARPWLVYFLVLAVMIAPVRLAGAMTVTTMDISAPSASEANAHCAKTTSMQMEDGQMADAMNTQEASDCCDSVCDCVNCYQACYHVHIVSLIGLTCPDTEHHPQVLHAHVEMTIRGITFPPFETPPIK